MLQEEEVYTKITAILHEEFEVEKDAMTMESNLFTDLELDSLDAIDLMVTLDNELDIEVNNEEAKNLRTVGDVVRFVMQVSDE
ncbi:MAG: acyl carrier protein [Campylobacterota bacterium]|nr:acyl carrier protein [Campylobacterota bacterium]